MVTGPRRRSTAPAFADSNNVYQSYFTTVLRPTIDRMLLDRRFSHGGWSGARRRILLWLAGALMALAAGTRSSAAMAPLATLIVLWVGRRRAGPAAAWLHFAAGGAITGAALMLPFFLMAPENFWFNVVSYHTLRDSGALLQALVYKAGFISRMVQAYFVVSALAVAAVLRPGREADKAEPLSGMRISG